MSHDPFGRSGRADGVQAMSMSFLFASLRRVRQVDELFLRRTSPTADSVHTASVFDRHASLPGADQRAPHPLLGLLMVSRKPRGAYRSRRGPETKSPALPGRGVRQRADCRVWRRARRHARPAPSRLTILSRPQDLGRFQREARLGTLAPENVMRVYDYGEAEGRPVNGARVAARRTLEERWRTAPCQTLRVHASPRDIAAGWRRSTTTLLAIAT